MGGKGGKAFAKPATDEIYFIASKLLSNLRPIKLLYGKGDSENVGISIQYLLLGARGVSVRQV